MTRYARLSAAVLATVALIALAGCDADEGRWIGPHDPTTSDARKVAIVGDSLIDSVDEQMVAGPLGQDGPLAARTIGATLLGGSTAWLTALNPRPDIVVIAQGTNNARDGWDATDDAALDGALAAVADTRCVVLVNLGRGGADVKPRGTAYPAGVDTANARYAAVVKADPTRMRLVNWRGWSAYSRGWYSTDGIHHTPTGATVYLNLIAQGVASCPAA